MLIEGEERWGIRCITSFHHTGVSLRENLRKRTNFVLLLSSGSTGLPCPCFCWLVSDNTLRSSFARFVPSLAQPWSAFVEILRDGCKGSSLLSHTGASMRRLLPAFCCVGYCGAFGAFQ